MNTQHIQSLNQLAYIFRTVTPKVQNRQISNSKGDENTASTRVTVPEALDTATQPTTHTVIANAPKQNTQSTRNNIPTTSPRKIMKMCHQKDIEHQKKTKQEYQ